MPSGGKRLHRKEAAQYLTEVWSVKRGVGYLQQIAAVGHDRHGHRGPAFQMAGRFPVYQIEDLDLYAQRVLGPRVNSTAELRDAATSEGAK